MGFMNALSKTTLLQSLQGNNSLGYSLSYLDGDNINILDIHYNLNYRIVFQVCIIDREDNSTRTQEYNRFKFWNICGYN